MPFYAHILIKMINLTINFVFFIFMLNLYAFMLFSKSTHDNRNNNYYEITNDF